MKGPEQQALSLEKLSDKDKDVLILRLWRDLQEARARSKELERSLAPRDGDPAQGGAGASPLLEKLQQTDAGSQGLRRSAANSRSGWGRGFVQARIVIAAGAIVALVFALDFAVGRYQQYRVEQMRVADLKLQHAAYEGMFVEVVNVAYEPDQKSYRLTMKVTNVEPGRPLYVMQSPVRVFEQAGLSWKEVPSRDPDGRAARVVKLTDAYAFETIFEPNLTEWTELIPGYMHIRFESNALVSERSDPDDDIVDRTDRYYVYLKPHGADDEAIRKRMKYRGVPPVYMPMPPH
jgi:hypothetical protein